MNRTENTSSANPLTEAEQVHGEFFFLGELIGFHGPRVSSNELVLPEGVCIEPWAGLPTMVWLKVNGQTVAGPSRREVMNSFVMKNTSTLNEIAKHRFDGIVGFSGTKNTAEGLPVLASVAEQGS